MASVSRSKTTTIVKNDTEDTTINVVLTIKLDSDGLSLSVPNEHSKQKTLHNSVNDINEEAEKVEWEIPDFDDDDTELIDFSKKEE